MPKDVVGQGVALLPLLDTDSEPRWELLLTRDEQSEIEEAIYIILMTPKGQRVMRPNFGSLLHELLFAPNNLETSVRAERYVKDALGMWEPRITVHEVQASPDTVSSERLSISIKYQVNATHNHRSLIFPFYLIPEE